MLTQHPNRPGRLGLVIVRGRSMLPALREQDVLLVRYGHLPHTGELAVVRFGEIVAIKRLSLHDGDEWWFSRDNPSEGTDSWTRGIPSVTSEVLGTAVVRLWPRPKRL